MVKQSASAKLEFPDLEGEVCDVYNATQIALDFIENRIFALADNDEANTMTYILHDAANRASALRTKFYAAHQAHFDAQRASIRQEARS